MSDKKIVYQEIIPIGKIYNLVVAGIVLLLFVLTIIFIATKLSAGTISTGLTLIFIVVMALTLRNLKLFVTNEEFTIKYWFLTFRIKISDIEAIEIKDVSLLPEPYRGHIKIYWGVEFPKGLKVFKLRKGDAVHIRTKKEETIIVTAQNNQRLAEALEQRMR
ncbi:MAG: PH domain-containing protein [bacterium]|nr:PH domain-containing protein [bacterium]